VTSTISEKIWISSWIKTITPHPSLALQISSMNTLISCFKAIPNLMTRMVSIELNELPPRIKYDVASDNEEREGT